LLINSELANFLQRYPICLLGSLKWNASLTMRQTVNQFYLQRIDNNVKLHYLCHNFDVRNFTR